MTEVMSQSEIDDLLSALDSGEIKVSDIEEKKEEKKVRSYDFLRPDKFGKEHLKTLEVIHENFGRLLNNFLSGYLRTIIEIEVLNSESLIFSEFINAISNPAILGIIDFSPLEGEIILDFSSDIAFAMIERILGGNIDNVNIEKRSLTEIEMTLVRNIIVKFINLLVEPWSNIIELSPRLDNIETNSQFAQIISPSESMALITLSVKMGPVEGLINICYPHYVLEPILSNLSSKLWFNNTGKKNLTEEERQSIEKKVEDSVLNVVAELGSSVITVNELLSLSRGDIIVLDRKVEDELTVKVGNKVKFKAFPGKKNNNVAIKIKEVFEEGES